MKRITVPLFVLMPILVFLLASRAGASGEHPSLGVNVSSLPGIKDRIASDPTVQAWMESVRSSALSYYEDAWSQCSDVGSEYVISHRAMTLAFVWQIDGTDGYAAKAVEHLQCIGYDPGDRDEFGWHWGGALMHYGFAYDWIEPHLVSAQDNEIRRKLIDEAALTMEIFERPPTYGMDPIKYYINARMRIGGGLGILAMALMDDPETEGWLEYVVEDFFGEHPEAGSVPYYLNILVTPDGTYNEGPSYQNDSFAVFLPFLLVYKDFSGIDLTGDFTAPGTGIWSDARLRDMYFNNLCMMTPERLQPTIDTGWRRTVYDHELIIPLFDEPRRSELQWFWNEGVNASRNKVFTVIWAGTPSSGTMPSWTSCRTSDYAVLRSGWDEEDVYVMVQSEHDPVKSTHCQPDQTSLLMFAKGQYLLIDPGDGRNYGSGTDGHMWLIYNPAAHNLVVVDGREQPDYEVREAAPSRLYSNSEIRDPVDQRAWFLSDLLDIVTVRLRYFNVPDVTITRTVALVRDRYVIAGDDLAADGSHTYEALLHYGGPAGEEAIEGTLSVEGGHITWQTAGPGGAALLLDATYFPAPSAITGFNDGYTNYEPLETVSHHYTRAAYSGSDVRFINVIDVADTGAGEAALPVNELASSSGTAVEVESAGGRDIWFFASTPEAVVQIPDEGIEAASSFAVLQFDADGAMAQLAAVDCTSISRSGVMLVASNRTLSIRLEPRDDTAGGEAWADQETVVSMHIRFPPESVLVNGSPVVFDWDGVEGAVSFTLPAGESAFAILSEAVLEEEIEGPLEEQVETADDFEPVDVSESHPELNPDASNDVHAEGDMESESPAAGGGCSCTVP